jgi:hypothetical protein
MTPNTSIAVTGGRKGFEHRSPLFQLVDDLDN